jgi:hypothetical protein
VETPGIANEEEIPAVHKWLCDQPKTFFVEGIRKLVDRWTKCIEKKGDYVEKRHTCSTPTFMQINWKNKSADNFLLSLVLSSSHLILRCVTMDSKELNEVT